MGDVLDASGGLIAGGDLPGGEALTTASRAERRAEIPRAYAHGPLSDWFRNGFGADGCLWTHQSRALELLASGDNVVIATGTASGKSLVFQLDVAHELLTGDGRALVLYPLKALLSDQSQRWRKFAAQLGLPENTVAELHGQVRFDERLDAVRNARVLLATPDT